MRSENPASRYPASKPLALVLLALLLVPPTPGRAEVVGENVLAGEANVERTGDITTIHASDGAIIEYEALNVWSYEELHFIQPDETSRVLNQVKGDATHIEGGLFANGIVYIMNPAGVFFGGEAVVEVGGLVAAAGHIETEDFQAGLDRFSLSGAVENRGRIQAASVALLGRSVANHGSIHAPDGTIALVAGDRVVLSRLGAHLHVEVEGLADDSAGYALQQTGSVDAGEGEVRFTTGDVYSLALNHEGITRGRTIALRAGSGQVRVAGALDASSSDQGRRGGDIAVTGELVSLEGARLDVSGTAGGGNIRVGGDLRGRGALPNARRTAVDADSLLIADATDEGDGGNIIVWADEATAFLGGISARGGAAGGDGGFAEVSGAVFLWTDGSIDLRAERGELGTLLYDPQDIEIVGGSDDGSDDPDTLADRLGSDGDVAGAVLFDDLGDLDAPFRIYSSEIEGTDADIVLEASNSISSTETLDVALLADRSLTLRTRNAAGDGDGSLLAAGIALSDVSFSTSGAGAIRIETGTSEDASVQADLAIGSLTTTGGDLHLETRNGAISVNGDLSTASAGGDGGAIAITAGDLDGLGDSDIGIAGGLDASGALGGAGGAIDLRTLGSEQPFPGGDNEPLTGGGAIAIGGTVASRGGDDATDGGAGGAITVRADGGSISAGGIDSSGGSGVGNNGGNAGAIALSTHATDYDDPIESSDANEIVVGALTALGGAGDSGRGGIGGDITLSTQASERVRGDDPENPGRLITLREADGGGSIQLASARADGGAAADGGRGGALRFDAVGEANTVTVTGSLTSRGGRGFDGAGGAGGSISTSTQDGGIQHGAESLLVDGVSTDVSILSAGGQGSTAGGRGGAINVSAGDQDADGDGLSDGESPVTFVGDLISDGGDGGSGRGGDGGRIAVGSRGERVDALALGVGEDETIFTGGRRNRTPLRGGGDLSLANVSSRGGDGVDGGRGGDFSGSVDEGRISTGDIDTSGGAGTANGGRAGNLALQTSDANQDDANDITAGFLRAAGGDGATGTGGRGGEVFVNVLAAEEVTKEDAEGNETVLQEALGAGDIALPQGISIEGGDGGTNGGNAGRVLVGIQGVRAGGGLPTLTVGDALTPAVLGGGGNGVLRGGNGAAEEFGSTPGVAIGAAVGDVSIGAIDTTGGDASGEDALGGNGGAVLVSAGFDLDAPAGALRLLGNVDAREGASTVVLLDPSDPDFGTSDAANDRLRMSQVDGGNVELFGEDGLEHGNQAGPQVRTTGDLRLGSGAGLGAENPFLVEGEGERRVVLGEFADVDTLSVVAAGRADVQVVNAGFLGGLDVSATGTGPELDIVVVQPGADGDDRISIEGQGGRAVVTEADGRGNQIDLTVRSQNRDAETRDDATLVLATGSVMAGAAFSALSDGDLVIGDAEGVVIEAGTVNAPDPIPAPAPGAEDPPIGADVTLLADADADGTGAVLDALGAPVGSIDLRRDMQEVSRLIVSGAAASREAVSVEAGIGDRGAPLVLSEGGVVEEAVVRPLTEAEDFDPEAPVFDPDPSSSAGIFLEGRGVEELEVITARVESGTGDIELSSTSDLRISGGLDTRPADPESQGLGGDIVLESGAGGRIVLAATGLLSSGGRQTWNGPVNLTRTVSVVAGGGLEVNGTLDRAPESQAGGLFAVLGSGPDDGDPDASRFGGDIGAIDPLGLLVLEALDDATPLVTLDLASVTTNASQRYGVDVELSRDVAFSSQASVVFDAALDAAAGADASATIDAVFNVGFGGDVGALNPLRGLDIETEGGLVRFVADGAQQVTTLADGIRIDTGLSLSGRLRVPAVATLVRLGGDLTLSSQGGDVLFADGEKLTATDSVRLEATDGTVGFGDVNTLRDFSVEAQTIRVFARRGGDVRLPGGGRARDGGADIFANDVSLEFDPIGGGFEIVDGGGAVPRIVTPSGVASAPGPLEVVGLGALPGLADILPEGPNGIVLDLALVQVGPGFESQELSDAPIDVPQELRVTREDATLASSVDPLLVAAVLGCDTEDENANCPAAATLPTGSPLATPRAAELAARLQTLTRGEGHHAARRALAAAAAAPGAPLRGPDTRSYLLELARWDAEAGLLGLDAKGRAAARQTLLDAVVSAVGSPDLDAERLWSALEGLAVAPMIRASARPRP